MSKQKSDLNLILRGTVTGLLVGLLPPALFTALIVLGVASTPAAFAASLIIARNFPSTIFSGLIGGLAGFLLSWLVVRLASHSRAYARVIGALVTMIALAVFEAFLVIGSKSSSLSSPLGMWVILLALLYLAIGVRIAESIQRNVRNDNNHQVAPSRGYTISMVLLIAFGVSGMAYSFLAYTLASSNPLGFPTSKPVAEWQTIPIMPNAIAGRESSDGSSYNFTVHSDILTVRAYYRQQLEPKGWNRINYSNAVKPGSMSFMDNNYEKSLTVEIEVVNETEMLILVTFIYEP